MKQGQKQNIGTDSTYFLTFTVVNWINVFTRKNHCEAIINSLKYCQKEKDLVVFAYCIMSHNNPVEAGLIKQAYEWVYSSARNY